MFIIIIFVLIKNGAEINKQTISGTAFSTAITLERFMIALFLLENGADYKQAKNLNKKIHDLEKKEQIQNINLFKIRPLGIS